MNVHLPATLAEALQIKQQHPAARPVLGGTDLLAQWQAGAARPDEVISLEAVGELRDVATSDSGATIGAGVSHFTLAHDPALAERLPALAAAARTVGAPAIQMMGTVGGNLANASPAADLPPALLAYGAEVVVASAHGRRHVAIERFFTGYRQIDLGPDELIVAVHVPWPAPGTYSNYYKVGTRAAQSIARVALAGCVRTRDGAVASVRLAAASVAATPTRLTSLEEAVRGRPLSAELARDARITASASIAPIDDVRGTAQYRRHALGALVERFLLQAASAPRSTDSR